MNAHMPVFTARSRRCPRGLTVLAAVCAATLAGAVSQPCLAGDRDGPIIVVDMRDDVVDFVAPQQIAQLPGPDGKVSFREACIAASNTPGPETIHFAIPQSEWTGDIAYLLNDGGSFVLSGDGTFVDFTTQTDFTGDTNPNGWEVGIQGTQPNAMGSPGIIVSGDGNTIKGLSRQVWRGYGVTLSGNNNRVIACTITGPLYAGVYINGGFYGPPATGNIVGGAEAGEGNYLSSGNSGVRIDGPARDNIVIGNTLTGTFYGAEIRSATCCPDQDLEAIDNRIGGPTPAERNIIAGAGKYGEEGFPVGGQVAVQYATGTIVEGNYIGVLADGVTVPVPQRGPVGVELRSAVDSVVRGNVIGGILVVGTNHYQGQRFGNAINVMGDCGGSVIQGNRIGIAATGNTAVPNRAGIVASYWSVNGMPVTPGPITIGGSESTQANIVANSETAGVTVASQIKSVRITGNSILANGTLGIDLIVSGTPSSGVTPNDPLDADTGGNNLQNFPVITSATSSAGGTHVIGTLHSTPSTTFTVEFFSNAACDPSGHGEGEVFIGSTQVTTDASGNASFDTSVPGIEAGGRMVTATATRNGTGDTSEFSACVAVQSNFVAGDTNGDGLVDVDDLINVILGWGPCPAPPAACAADVNFDGVVDVDDLIMVILNWG